MESPEAVSGKHQSLHTLVEHFKLLTNCFSQSDLQRSSVKIALRETICKKSKMFHHCVSLAPHVEHSSRLGTSLCQAPKSDQRNGHEPALRCPYPLYFSTALCMHTKHCLLRTHVRVHSLTWLAVPARPYYSRSCLLQDYSSSTLVSTTLACPVVESWVGNITSTFQFVLLF